MADNDNKRYYWLKLKKDFFQQHQIKVLKSLPNGRLYALIYLELLAESTSHEGQLRYSEMLPYDIVTLSSVIDEDKDNVEKAIETLVKLELVEILEDQTIYMREIQSMIGSETGIAKRVREYRNNKRLQCNENVTKSIEYRDKSKEYRVKNNTMSKPTLEEVTEYCNSRNSSVNPKTFYEYFEAGNWVDSKGNKVKNWKQKLITWEKNTKPTTKESIPNYQKHNNISLSNEELEQMIKERNNE